MGCSCLADRVVACFGKEDSCSILCSSLCRLQSEPRHYRLGPHLAFHLGVILPPNIESHGTTRHDEENPRGCRICWVHHRHIIRPHRSRPCENGVECWKCHAPHTELNLRTRLPIP